MRGHHYPERWARASGGGVSAVQYVSIADGAVKYDPQGFENAAPAYSGVGSRILTLDIDEATGVASDPVNMYGYTVPLVDADGNAYTHTRQDLLHMYLLTNLAPTANVEPIIVLHAGAGGPLNASLGAGGFLDLSTNWRVNSARCAGAGWLPTVAAATHADTRGLMAWVEPRSGSGCANSAGARDAAFAQILTTNTGPTYAIANSFTFTHATVGVMVTGAYTGTISMIAGVYALPTDGILQVFP